MDHVIAIVEDSEDVAALEFALSAIRGAKVMRMSDGRSLMKKLEAESFNFAAIVTDLNLPFFDGFEIIQAVRSNARHSRVPIIVITGDGRTGIAQRAKELGANAFFLKPYSPGEIFRTLEALLNAS